MTELRELVHRMRELLRQALDHLARWMHRHRDQLARLVELQRELDAGRYVTASQPTTGLCLAAVPGQLGVDVERRTIAGLVVPFGSAGHTSGGRLTFSAGSLTISEPRRVKLLREHDQRDVVGYATELVEVAAGSDDRPAGLYGTFHVPDGDNGDRALAEASNGLRDAFSVGVQLDDATMTRLRRSQGAPVAAAGQLREVSQVSVPAFDDARVAATTGALVVSSWSDPNDSRTINAGAAGTTNTGGTTMFTEAQRRRLAELITASIGRDLTDDEQRELGQLQQLATAAGLGTVGNELPEQNTGRRWQDTGQDGDQGDQAGDAGSSSTSRRGRRSSSGTGDQAQASGPAVVRAAAGAAVVTGAPSTYRFDGTSSLVRDAYMARMDGDRDAADRVRRFNAELRDGNPASVAAFATAAATRTDVDGAGTDVPETFMPTGNRAELMREVVDRGRPFISRLDTVPITNAAPFAIPEVGRFEGVGDHTEGQPHRPAGTLTLGGDTVQPTSVSGAWEVSRELVDSTNPAIDRIAMREMLRDYRRESEAKILALVAARAAQPDAAANAYNISTPLALRGAMLDFVNDDEEPGDLVVVSKGMLRTLGLDTDNQDRPQLPFVGPYNAVGTMRAGATGFAIDGAEVVRSTRMDTAVGANTGVQMRRDGVLWAESRVLQFRFDEVLGPGVVKLALWAYNGAAILDVADVQVLNTGADPTP